MINHLKITSMRITIQFIIAFFVVLVSACDRNPAGFSGNSYLVFGHFYGECFGELCVEIFKIQNEQLYEDTLDNYPTVSNLPHVTDYRQRSSDEYDKIKHLQVLIPELLFEESSILIGQPDAGDWGGFYVETDQSGEKRYWLIDKMKSNIPEYLYEFTDSLDAAISGLN